MKCPVCHDVRMREVEKNGILIDVCPDCKGVWLDRGELDKLMSGVREFRREYEQYDDDRHYPRREERKHDKYEHGKKKKTVFDIFDDLF